ncbi:MAG: FtsX-like permease family protein [Gaiellaceae bacterium]
MSTLARIAFKGLVRSPGRTLVRVLVLSAAVGLLGAMVLFIGNSLRTMTASATSAVALDWQGPVGSRAQAVRAAAAVSRQPGIAQASATATAPFATAVHVAGAGTIRTGSGSVLAVPPGYLQRIQTFRYLHGSLRHGQVVLDQQLAATLQAGIGDRVTLTARPGTTPQSYRVSGVALVTSPDVLFQPLNPQSGPAPAQPPAQIAILPLATFASTLAPQLPALTPASAGTSAVPGAQDGVQWQVQVQVASSGLGSSPGQALLRAGQIRNRVERTLPGQVQFVDNLSESLNSAAGDALYAETLYIMLAVPGALIALGLAYLAALGTVERDRRELSLLRARGGSRRSLLGFVAVESTLIGVLAGVIGSGLAALAVTTLVQGTTTFTLGRSLATVALSIAVAVIGAAAARIGASARVFTRSVSEGRRSVERERTPLWQRLHLDILALAISGLIYWLTARTGFSAVVNPDSNPTLSLSIYMFFAPALLWIGATLLLVRVRGRAVTFLIARGAGNRATTTRAFLLSSAGRRGAAINRGLVLVGLLLAFGVNLGIFTATYDQQARVDAQLTVGADVVTTAPPGVATRNDLAAQIARVPGVVATTALDHSYAYVGPDLQDTYGVDAATLARATTLRDSYFLGGSAATMMARLRSRPDAILVSKETITDYSLRQGDLLKLRVLDRATGHFNVVPFRVVGIVSEFPAAPKDSFMVANAAYLQAASHDPGPNVVFAKTSGDPAAIAAAIARATRSSGTAVKDIRQQTAQTVSSITTVDLTGISRIEELFAIVLAAAAMGLFVAIGLGERRHEFATMAALGSSLREIGAFLWTEAALVLGAGLALAAGLGWLLSTLLVAMLQHVFDPPPDALAIPWTFLAELAGAAAAAALLASLLAVAGIRRLKLGAILREQ